MSFQLGAAGTALIQNFEKCRLTAYPDSGGVPTIGWGHTGPDVSLGNTCSQDKADEWFEADTAKAVAAVNAGLNAIAASHLSQNEFDAMVCFTYNVGIGAEAHSTLLKHVNLCEFEDAADEFLKWNHVNGMVSEGLARRRTAVRCCP